MNVGASLRYAGTVGSFRQVVGQIKNSWKRGRQWKLESVVFHKVFLLSY